MEFRRKVSGRYVRRAVLGILLATLCFHRVFFSVSAADEKVVSVKTDSENIYLYVKGVSGIMGETVQIGTVFCENVAVDSMEALSVPLRTVILMDNSYSIKADRRSDIQEILNAVVDGRMEGEEFRVGTFSDSVTWLCGYTTDYVAVKSILDNLEYASQDTYFSDCLYGVIEEMSEDEDPVYSRIIIVSDGADDQAIGYTNQEVSDLLGQRGIPVYTIGISGDNSALGNMFSFSRASKAEYYLLDGSVSKEEIIVSLLEDHQMSCIRITPDSALMDGSQKRIKVVLQTDKGDVEVTASVDMPFSSRILPTEEAQETSGETQEISGETQETSGEMQASSDESWHPSEESLEPMDEAADASEATQASAGVLVIFLAFCGGAIFIVILMIVIMLIVVGRKKACRKAEADTAVYNAAAQRQMPQMQVPMADMRGEPQAQGDVVVAQTMVLSRENTDDGNTVSLWNQAAGQPANTYLVLRDNARLSSMFKVPIRDVIRIGRKDADIVIDYDKYISAKQCEIIKRGALLYIKDLGSANGTYYEDVRVQDQEIPITSGGTIQIGQSKFTITIVME